MASVLLGSSLALAWICITQVLSSCSHWILEDLLQVNKLEILQKPLPLILILGILRQTQSLVCPSPVTNCTPELRPPWKSKTSVCFRIIRVQCCTCSNQHWNQMGMPWGTCGTGEHFNKQPFLGASFNPYCTPQILCSNAFPTQL